VRFPDYSLSFGELPPEAYLSVRRGAGTRNLASECEDAPSQ